MTKPSRLAATVGLSTLRSALAPTGNEEDGHQINVGNGDNLLIQLFALIGFIQHQTGSKGPQDGFLSEWRWPGKPSKKAKVKAGSNQFAAGL